MSDHGHGDHHPNQAHHFDTLQQQVEAGKLGMWLFLATEVLLFAGLFCAYAVYRYNHPEVFEHASQFLDTTWGAINTIVLIASSWTVALAVRAAQMNDKGKTVLYLGLTLLGAAAFMGIKAIEYSHKFHEHLMWGLQFDPAHQAPLEPGEGEAEEPAEAPQRIWIQDAPTAYSVSVPGEDLVAQGSNVTAPPLSVSPENLPAPGVQEAPDDHDQKVRNVHIFFGIYFCMTGLHGLHVLIGAAVIIWVLLRARRGDFSSEYYLPVDLAGLYWHLVDLIWIYLFPLLYLIG